MAESVQEMTLTLAPKCEHQLKIVFQDKGNGASVRADQLECKLCKQKWLVPIKGGYAESFQVFLIPIELAAAQQASQAEPAKPKKTDDEKILDMLNRVGGDGPGFRLSVFFFKKGFPSCQACEDLAKKMNAWGPECGQHVAEIVADILPRAKEWLSTGKKWAKRLLGAVGAEDVVLSKAISLYVTKAIEEWEWDQSGGRLSEMGQWLAEQKAKETAK